MDDEFALQYRPVSVYIVGGLVLPAQVKIGRKGGENMRELVRLRTRPSRNGKTFTYFLDYVNENGRRRRISLGHADKHKAERQRAQKERELRMGVAAPESMRLSEFLEDSLLRTGSQIRQSTQEEHRYSMRHFIRIVGDINIQ